MQHLRLAPRGGGGRRRGATAAARPEAAAAATAAAGPALSTAAYSGYIVAAPPRVASNGRPNRLANSSCRVPIGKLGTQPVGRGATSSTISNGTGDGTVCAGAQAHVEVRTNGSSRYTGSSTMDSSSR